MINIDTEKIKFLPISKQDLILALDRLTRFKTPEIKYNRVISDIITKYLLTPKLSKIQLQDLPIKIKKNIFEKIWNESIQKYSKKLCKDKSLNKIIFDELCNLYKIDENNKELINLDIDIKGVLEYIETPKEVPINLKRLLKLTGPNLDIIALRKKYSLLFPIEKVLLCEGITEEILMPQFAKLAKYDFEKNGIKLISAGGKNKVAKLYCELKNELNIPIFILLDADAEETKELINPILRECDKIHLIQHGEFEDIFSVNLIKRTLNNRFKNICECRVIDLKNNEKMTKTLTDFYRIHELGDYQKADFAKELAQNIKYTTDLTEEIIQIISEIKKL